MGHGQLMSGDGESEAVRKKEEKNGTDHEETSQPASGGTSRHGG